MGDTNTDVCFYCLPVRLNGKGGTHGLDLPVRVLVAACHRARLLQPLAMSAGSPGSIVSATSSALPSARPQQTRTDTPRQVLSLVARLVPSNGDVVVCRWRQLGPRRSSSSCSSPVDRSGRQRRRRCTSPRDWRGRSRHPDLHTQHWGGSETYILDRRRWDDVVAGWLALCTCTRSRLTLDILGPLRQARRITHASIQSSNTRKLSHLQRPHHFAIGHATLTKSSIASTNSRGCSIAAKCPPLSISRCHTKFPV